MGAWFLDGSVCWAILFKVHTPSVKSIREGVGILYESFQWANSTPFLEGVC